MPAPPKRIEDLLSLFSYEQITPQIMAYHRSSTASDIVPLAFYDPLYQKVYIQPELLKNPKRLNEVLIHEYTHKVTPDISREQFLQIYKDISTLGPINPTKMKDVLLYSEEDRPRELLARFAETYPSEILNPTTQTGKILQTAFATKYNWEQPPSFIDELKGALKRVNKNNIPQESQKIIKMFSDRIKNYISNSLRMAYIKTKSDIHKQNKVEYDYGVADEILIDKFTNSDILYKSYADLDSVIIKRLNSILSSSFEGQVFSPSEAKKRILEEIPELTKNRASTILRTEYSNIRNLASERTYKDLDPEGQNRYIMLGPMDNRTAESTKELHRLQGRGLPLEELKDLVREVAMKYHPETYTPDRPWILHINTRRVLHRVM